MALNRNQKLSVTLAAVAGIGVLTHVGNSVFHEIMDVPSEPVCGAAADIAKEFKDQGYKGLAYGTAETDTFFILTNEANKKWALLVADDNDPDTACVVHEGKSFETAQPTGRLLMASASNLDAASIQPAVFIPASASSGEPPTPGPDGSYDTKELMSWLNARMEQSTVFKGDLGYGRSVRVLESRDNAGPTWTLLYSTSKGKSFAEGQGVGFSFAQNFKPSFKPLQ